MSDFIREVDEDYRRDRIVQFLSRYQVPLAALIIAIVVGAGLWRIWLDNKVATAEADNARYAAADQLERDGKTAQARAAYEAIARNGPAGYAMLSRMRAAALMGETDPEAGAKAYDAIANDDGVAGSMRDTARMRGALLRLDIEPPAAFEQRYGRFTSTGFAFHDTMRELLALAALKRDDLKSAGGYLDAIIVDPLAPPSLRNRAEAFRALVTAGPATAMKTQPPPATVTPLQAAPAPAKGAPPAPSTPTPPAPSPAAPPAAAATPIPPPPAKPDAPAAAPEP